jgi:tape measure domain-containing protein
MPFNLGIMSVGFEMDLSGLTSGATKAESIIEGLSSIGEQAGATLTESFSMPESSIGVLVDSLDRIRLHLRTLLDSVGNLTASVDAGFAQMAEEASIASEAIDSRLMSIQEHAMSAGNAVREAGSMSHAAGGGFLSMAGNLGMAAMGFQIVTQMALQAGDALLSPAASAEQTQMAFQTLLGSAKAAKQEMQDLNDFAAKTPFQTQGIDQAAQKMLAFGFNTKDIIPDLTAFGDALAGLGKTSDADMEQMVGALGKIQAQGHLTGESMQELSDLGIPVWQLLAKETGKSTTELQRMVSQGAIPAKDAIAMLDKGIESSNLGGGMKKQADTFNGTLSTVLSNAKIALASFGGPLLDGAKQGLKSLGDMFASKGFQEFATKTGKQIADIMGNLGKFFSNPAFAQFGHLLGDVIGKGFEKIMGYLSSPAFGNFMKTVGDGLVKVFQTLSPFVQSVIHDFQEFGKQIGPVLTPIIQGFFKALQSPEFQGFIKLIGEGIAGAIHIALPLIGEIIKNVVKFGEEIAVRLQPLIEKFMEWWKMAWPGISLVLKGVFDGIVGIVKIAWALVSGIIKIGLDLLSGNWKQAWEDLKDMLKGVWDGILDFLGGLGETIVGILATAGASIYDAIKKPFSDAWDFISNFFGNVGQLFNDLFSGNFGALQGDVTKLGFAPKGFAGGVENYGGGLAKVHKDELIYLPPHSSVYTATQSAAMLQGGGNGEIHLHNHIYLDGQPLAASIMPHVNQMALAMHGPRARIA